MIWMEVGTDKLQADPVVFVSWIPIPSDEVAPCVPPDCALSAFAAQAGRATAGGAAMVVAGGFGVVLTGLVGDLLISQPPRADAKRMNTAPRMNR